MITAIPMNPSVADDCLSSRAHDLRLLVKLRVDLLTVSSVLIRCTSFTINLSISALEILEFRIISHFDMFLQWHSQLDFGTDSDVLIASEIPVYADDIVSIESVVSLVEIVVLKDLKIVVFSLSVCLALSTDLAGVYVPRSGVLIHDVWMSPTDDDPTCAFWGMKRVGLTAVSTVTDTIVTVETFFGGAPLLTKYGEIALLMTTGGWVDLF
jgi:hypothetical protein